MLRVLFPAALRLRIESLSEDDAPLAVSGVLAASGATGGGGGADGDDEHIAMSHRLVSAY